MHTFTAGEVVTPANLNNNTVSAFGFTSAPPLCKLRQTVLQTSLSSWQSVLWDTEDVDSDNGHSTVTNTSRYTAQTAGWYTMLSTIPMQPSSSSTVVLQTAFKLNGSTSSNMLGKAAAPCTSASQYGAHIGDCRFLNVGDYIEVGVYVTVGTVTLNCLGAGSDSFPCFSIEYSHT